MGRGSVLILSQQTGCMLRGGGGGGSVSIRSQGRAASRGGGRLSSRPAVKSLAGEGGLFGTFRLFGFLVTFRLFDFSFFWSLFGLFGTFRLFVFLVTFQLFDFSRFLVILRQCPCTAARDHRRRGGSVLIRGYSLTKDKGRFLQHRFVQS